MIVGGRRRPSFRHRVRCSTSVLYNNPRYVLNKIEIEPRGHFSERLIRQAAGLEPGAESLDAEPAARSRTTWKSCPTFPARKVERHFPDKITIHITERVPVVKIVGLNIDLGTRETFYLDRDCVVLKPREDEDVAAAAGDHRPDRCRARAGHEARPAEPDARAGNSRRDRPQPTLHTVDRHPHDRPERSALHHHGRPRSDMTITFRLDYIDQQLQRLHADLRTIADFQQRHASHRRSHARQQRAGHLLPNTNNSANQSTHHYVLGKITQYRRRT